ncbi:MAG TPA: hypothetical protein VI384_04490 [Candidatus Dormibacteraeota bacterium]
MGDYSGVGFNRQSLGNLLDPGGFFKDTPQQPGVGGQNVNNTQLVKDPTTGLYYNPQTGTSYTDAGGDNVVTDPNVAQQVATNYTRSQQFLAHLGGIQQQQGQLAGTLSHLIAGNGPSQAQMQTQGALDQIGAQQMSQAAGIGGDAGPLAHLLAMRNTGAAQIGAMNAGSLARVAESTAARGQLADLLGGMAGSDASLGSGFAGLANQGQMGQQGLNTATNDSNQKKNTQLGSAGIGALGALLA